MIEIVDVVNYKFAYGHDHFVCVSKKEKYRYLFTQLFCDMIGFMYYTKDSMTHSKAIRKYMYSVITKIRENGLDFVPEVIDEFIEKMNIDETIEYEFYPYVDHQSVIIFPKKYPVDENGEEIDYDFARDFIKTVLNNDNYIITGGSDESINSARFNTQFPYDRLRKILSDSDWVSVKKDNMYVLFHKNEGTKLRFDFSENSNYINTPPKRYRDKTFSYMIPENYYPELIDLKITDRCDYNCDFCYQSSHSDGKHADTEHIFKMVDYLYNKGVLEIAPGGGDPLEHPNILSIIRYIKDKGMSLGLSTKNYQRIFNDMDNFKCIDGIGISISTIEEFKNFCDAYRDNKINKKHNDIKIHIIPELFDINDLAYIIGVCSSMYINILYLGFKNCGRGKHCDRYRLDKEYFLELNKSKGISVDTAMVNLLGKELLDKFGVDAQSYYSDEGIYSKYIDLVSNKIGASSFSPNQYEFTDYEMLDKYLRTPSKDSKTISIE
jgi:hypothetical protein